MPNWCTGDLKIRGKYKDIKEFLSKEMFILGEDILNREYKAPVINEEDGIEISVGKQGMWFRNAYRSFFEDDIFIYLDLDDEKNKDEKVITANLGELSSAGGIDTKALIKLSEQYNLDFKIYAYEKGMQFNIDFEVHKGEVIINDKIEFNDYIWECTNPQIGG